MLLSVPPSVFCLLFIASIVQAEGLPSSYPVGQAHNVPINLDEESFPMALADSKNPFWFFKFYAPWCGHCKRMTPVLESVAPKVQGKMAIGKVDCTKHKSVCNEHGVKGFPTLKYYMHGEFFDYNGGRDEKAIMAFAEKMSAPPITVIKRLEEATLFSQKKTDAGILFLASDKSKESSKLYQIFEQVARRNQASAYFLWMTQSINDEDDGKDSAYISRVEAGVVEPRYYDLDQNDENPLTVESLDAWVKDQNVPTLVTFGADNFFRISRKGRPLVVAVVDIENEELVKGIKAHMMDFILTTQRETVEKYYYGLFDGKKWSKFLAQFHVNQDENPQYLLLDMPGKQYWRNETYTKLKDFLIAVHDGSIPSKAPDKAGLGDTPFAWIADKFLAYFPYSLGPVFVLICLIVILVTPSKDDLQPRVRELQPEETGKSEEGDNRDDAKDAETKKDK